MGVRSASSGGRGQARNVPRGVEVLVSKAAVDTGFRRQLLGRRSRVAEEIHLSLDPAEAAMLDGVPEQQLEAIIVRTKVHPKHRAAFLGWQAAAMLLALEAQAEAYDFPPAVLGITPDAVTPGRIAIWSAAVFAALMIPFFLVRRWLRRRKARRRTSGEGD
jgi:hypothetical protein